MDKRLAVILDVANQVIEFYPPEGVPAAAATFEIWRGYDSQDNAAVLSGNGTMDTTSLNPAAAAGFSQANRRRVELASTTGLAVGRRYRLENALGQWEWVKIAAIATDDYIDLEDDLAYDYGTTATLKGYRHTLTVDTTFASTESNMNDAAYPYRLLWSYTVGGVPCRHWQYFDVVRVAPQHGVAEEDLQDVWGGLDYLIAPGQRERYLREAVAELELRLRLRNVDPVDLADGPVRDGLIKKAFDFVAARDGKSPQGWADPAEFRRTATRAFLDTFELALGQLKTAQNRGEGNLNAASERPLLLIS